MKLLPSLLALTALFPLSLASSKLFSGATIIAWDDKTNIPRIIRSGSLLTTNDTIVAISPNPLPSDLPDNTQIVNVTGQIITPGFIDTHRHGWQTAFKTIASNTTLAEYFFRYGEFAAAASFTARDVYLGQLAGLYEALNAGVTTTLDHAHHTWSNGTAYAGLNASVESRARVFWAYTFHEVPSLNYTVAEQIPNFREIAGSSILDGTNTHLAIAYDSWGPNPPPAAQQVANLAKEFNISALTTHCVSGPWGIDNLPSDLARFNMLNTSIPVVFSHGSFITANDAQLLRATDQYMAITPESEMHYGHIHPNSAFTLDQASLGVDTHFTFSTDILTQARIWLQSVRYQFFSQEVLQWRIGSTNPMSVVQAFYLATRAGGLALRRPDLGVIKVGAKADLIVWDAANSPALLGWADPIAAVMLHASVGDILHVTVGGEFVKRNGKITAKGYEGVRREFRESAERIRGIWEKMPYPVLTGDFQSGYPYVEPRRADTQRGEGDGYGELYLE
ncbi:Fc.00g043730.m01.CDS01 [Cosmosporella sp. VM-42]